MAFSLCFLLAHSELPKIMFLRLSIRPEPTFKVKVEGKDIMVDKKGKTYHFVEPDLGED